MLIKLVIYILSQYTGGKSSNRSPGNFNILVKISNIQKIPIFQRKVYYIRADFSNFHFDRPIYSVSIAIKNGYPNCVKSHLIIQFLGLKTGKITEISVFSETKLV